MHILSQITPPAEGDNPWIWLCGVLASGLVFMFLRYDTFRDTTLKREQELNDKLADALPEIVSLMRELKEFKDGRSTPA